ERMAQRVRADAHPGAARGHVAAHQPVDAAYGEAAAAVVDEQRRFAPDVLSGLSRTSSVRLMADTTYEQVAVLQVRAPGGSRTGVERHKALLAALAEHPHHPGAQVHIFHVEPDQLADAQA